MKRSQLLAAAVSVVAVNALLVAHGRDARYVEEVGWKKEHVARTFAASRSEFGLGARSARSR